MKKLMTVLIIAAANILALTLLLTISALLSHGPYVATEKNGVLTYNDEDYVLIGYRSQAQEIIGTEISLGEVLGEIRQEKFDLLDYLWTNHPIQAVAGDDDLNFIAKPVPREGPMIYCKKELFDGLTCPAIETARQNMV